MDPNGPNSSGFRNNGPFEFHYGGGPPPDMGDIFSHFSFGFGSRPQRRNQSINISVTLTLEEVLQGKDITAEVSLPSGQRKIVNIKIPPGIEHGQQIRYQGMGDNSIPNYRPGDLIVNINVLRHHQFIRDGNNILIEKKIPVWAALLGETVTITTLSSKNLDVKIPEGTQPDTVLSCKGEGIPNMRTRVRGNLLVRIKVDIPKNLSKSQLQKIQEIRDGV